MLVKLGLRLPAGGADSKDREVLRPEPTRIRTVTPADVELEMAIGIAVTEVPTLEEVPVIRMEGCSLTHGQGNRRKLTHKGKACQTKVPALKSRQTVSGSTVPW